MQSGKTTLRYEVQLYPGDAFPLTPAHFNLERMAFGMIRQCPATYDEFRSKYLQMKFVVCSVIDKDMLVAFKLLDMIVQKHYHSFITVVIPTHRKRGIAQVMSEQLCIYLYDNAPFFLTKFSVPETWRIEFESSRLRRLTTADALQPQEVQLLRALASRWNSERIRLTRIQEGYYDYRNGTTGDALFKAYEMEDSQQSHRERQNNPRERGSF